MKLRFLGHACFEVTADDDRRLCIDPFEAGAFDGAVDLPPLDDTFDAWVASHEHADHAAGHAIPSAVRLRPPAPWAGLSIDAIAADHDEFGGRLRGGRTDLLRFSDGDSTLVHLGDIGERPTGRVLDWLLECPIDVLIVPTGGYFTLGPDGAAELSALVQPRFVVPCHAREHGVRLPQLGSVVHFAARFTSVSALELRAEPLLHSVGCAVFAGGSGRIST